MNLLFVSSRNIYNSTGELRLVKTRANVLKEKFNISSDFICIRNKEILNSPQEVIDSDSKFFLFTYSMTNMFSYESSKKNVEKKIREIISEYDAVILSGELVLSFVNLVKSISSVKVIYDIHGVCDELSEFSSGKFLVNCKRKFIYYLFQHLEKKYISKFDAAFAVTSELKEHVEKKYNAHKLNYFIVPCTKKHYNIDQLKIAESREIYRKKYSVSSNDVLFIYSGGYSPWQCIDESIDLFTKINTKMPNSKFLILSMDKDKIDTHGNKNIIKDSVTADEVDSVLCAGDYAFMLRGDYVTNHVAFPNKYCEYLASGMKIISSPYLYSISKNIVKFNTGIVLNNNDDFETLINYIDKNKCSKNDVLKIQEILDEISFDKTLEPVANYLKSGD